MAARSRFNNGNRYSRPVSEPGDLGVAGIVVGRVDRLEQREEA
jgi:hypothetical protein